MALFLNPALVRGDWFKPRPLDLQA